MSLRVNLSFLIFLTMMLGIVQATYADQIKKKAVVYEFELTDSSGEGEHPDHQPRIQRVTQLLKDLLVEHADMEIVATDPAQELIDKRKPLQLCNGCETKIAAQLGADYAVLGRIHKVSSLILQVAITVTDTHRDVPIRAVKVGIRGDTEEAWTRGVRYIFKNKLNVDKL